jgi:hypothetical protein
MRVLSVFATAFTVVVFTVALQVEHAVAGSGGTSPPSWISGSCEEDGSPALTTTKCTTPANYVDTTTASPAHCDGAVLCDATWADLKAQGYDTSEMQAEEAATAAALAGTATTSATADLATASMPSNWTGFYGWNDFYLYAYDSTCQGTVTYNNHCAWLFNHYTWYEYGIAKHTYTTQFPARSGNNKPADDWWPDHGPAPNGDWTSSTPTLGHFHWAWKYGVRVGFVADTADKYYPGKFPLDPWSVTKNGTDRGAFEIHGGRNGHGFWDMYTQGCIRMPVPSVDDLKSLWVNYTDNKGWSPGPDNPVHFAHP